MATESLFADLEDAISDLYGCGDISFAGDADRARKEAFAAVGELRALVVRAAYVAEHLMQMIDRETWRSSGGDDGQGHYEGDYHEERTALEVQSWKSMAA